MWRISIPREVSILFSKILSPTTPKRFAIIEAGLIGLVSGLAAFILKEGAGWLGSLRISTSLNSAIPAWILLPIIGLIGGLLTGFLVERLAPETAGSGIPQVKAALAGEPISLDFRVAFAKLIGTMFTMGSGLTLGRQGPTVQIGAALAAWISRWVPTSPNYRRQLIACGAAAGLAAGFNAPIAGVLFVVEELLHDVSGITLGPAIIASFIGAVVSRLLGGQEFSDSATKTIILETVHDRLLYAREIPLFILLGILAGVLGAIFSRSIISVSKFNRRVLRWGLPQRMAVAGLLSGLVVSLLPLSFRNNTGIRQLILSGELSWETSALVFTAHFILTIIAASSGAPGGLFAPSLVLGSALGHLVGTWESELMLGIDQPMVFAFAGMGAFFCAVARTPMTAVVIVFEITTDFGLVLPLMISSVVAYLIAEKIDPESLYDQLLKLSGIELKSDHPIDGALENLRAANVMQRNVETLAGNLTLEQVIEAFAKSPHRGFPVVENGKLVGIITQTDLAQISNRQLPNHTPINQLMTTQPITVNPDDNLTHVLYLLGHYKLSRLPVIEHHHLVGIITRSDIIRAELGQINGEKTQVGRHYESSYIAYQTRGPQTGNGRLLVSLYNPQTAPALLKVAVAIAQERNYELECITVITIPYSKSPSETLVRLTKSRRLLQQAERLGQNSKISVHTQIRVAHDVAQAILETTQEEHIDLLLMGWHGDISAPDRIFGNVMDAVIRLVPCQVMLIKWGQNQTPHDPQTNTNSDPNTCPVLAWHRWLVPVRDTLANSVSVQLLPALIKLSFSPKICLFRVVKTLISTEEIKDFNQDSENLSHRLNTEVIFSNVCSNSVSEAVIDLADKDQCDVIVLGASREGMLRQVIQGNIPEAIAKNCQCTVILVRPAIEKYG
ncbi:chloride channel protein [Planktothrix agardhii 1806]|jgi:CIC family chloride channel protein|uniref:chloride channel protein n=1 Tax=Planktothrix agardhii TaxID=1160 RepID=UPI001D09C975|nr:chloride channel protein [Planktothrix agardhii]MCB8759582.1 chloride channel protein [Planktothrix agardhii 1813]MCB8764667.1 chloride channel protein [Planktothrix agardhii 1809]MCB8778315.1 chloride channel protein [Planktothrix agardhii 1031]MCB8782724.1 chloride channel protein [Planktothrix agardhii 1808]MCF3566248.1 chloride channel protein [Planktothrix agardhii 1807]